MKKMAMIAVAALTAGVSLAQVQGLIIQQSGQQIAGKIQWRNSSKAYTVEQKGGVVVEIEPEKVRELRIPEPPALRKAIAESDIAVLTKLIKEYAHLNWDTVATRHLAESYLKRGDAKAAREICEKVVAANPEAAYLGEMAPAYWTALIKCDRSAKAEEYIAQAIQSGDRRSSAFALNRRGDLIFGSGDSPEAARKALRDGYLRVVTLYRDVKDAQPEALYKAARCFDTLKQTGRADTFRTRLQSEFASSEWAKK